MRLLRTSLIVFCLSVVFGCGSEPPPEIEQTSEEILDDPEQQEAMRIAIESSRQ